MVIMAQNYEITDFVIVGILLVTKASINETIYYFVITTFFIMRFFIIVIF